MILIHEFIIMNPSLKEKGNEYFQQGEFALASAMYRKYVKGDHSDNKNAYSNWSLCAFKLHDYQECIRVCQLALEIDPVYTKVLYRLVQAYLSLQDSYGTMVSASRFCDIPDIDHSSKEYKEVSQILKQAKQKVCTPLPEVLSDKDSNLLLQQPKQAKNQKQTTKGSKIFALSSEHINELIQSGVDKWAVNGLYQNINNQKKIQKCNQIINQIKTIKGLQVSQEEQSKIAIKQRVRSMQNHRTSVVQNDGQSEVQKSEKQALNTKPVNDEENEKQKQMEKRKEEAAESQKLPQEKSYQYQQLFLKPLEKKNDIFQGFFEVVMQICEEKLVANQLSHLLLTIIQRYPHFAMLQMSLSQQQKGKLKSQFRRKVLAQQQQILKAYCS